MFGFDELSKCPIAQGLEFLKKVSQSFPIFFFMLLIYLFNCFSLLLLPGGSLICDAFFVCELISSTPHKAIDTMVYIVRLVDADYLAQKKRSGYY